MNANSICKDVDYRKKELRKTDYLSLLQSLEINLRQELLILFEREDKD